MTTARKMTVTALSIPYKYNKSDNIAKTNNYRIMIA